MKTCISLATVVLGLALPSPVWAAGTLEFNVRVHQLTHGMSLSLLALDPWIR